MTENLKEFSKYESEGILDLWIDLNDFIVQLEKSNLTDPPKEDINENFKNEL